MNRCPFGIVCLILLLALCSGRRVKIEAREPAQADLKKLESFPAATRKIEFQRDIVPILNAHCLKCHGPEKQKNGLRLDRKADAFAGGDSGPPILPGKSAQSRLIQLVAGIELDNRMPPKGDALTPAEIGLLRAWIDQGADWPETAQLLASSSQPPAKHWSFLPPRRPPLPEVKNRKWVRNEIDRFILARLEKENVRPSSEADRYTLIRRLSLDLTGLPPTPAETEAFINDRRPDAYEQLISRLLNSPHFGEQWARHWLDLARYADTDGYEKDFYRPHAWRWRNWVIDAINRDQPFDAFTRDQIAGDLLPNASLEQRVATGFHRNTLLNREGGVDIEEDRCKIVVDRVTTVGTAWLGLTVGCAECHSHKYDPITQKEFYQLYAFFNSVDDRDIKAPLPTQLAGVQNQVSALEQAKRQYAETPDAEFEAWTERIAKLPDIWWSPKQEDYDLPTFGANNGANLYPQEDGSFLVTGMIENKTHYIMMLNTKLKGITGIRVEPMADEMLPQLGPGWAKGNFVLTELYVETASLKAVNQLKSNAVERAFADYAEPGHGIEMAIDGVMDKGGWAVAIPGLPMHGVDRCAVFVMQEDLGYGDEGMRLKVSLVQHEGKSFTLGRVRVSYTTAPRETLASHTVPQRMIELARLPKASRNLDQQVELKRYFEATFRTHSPALLEITKALAESPGVKGEVQAQTLVERRSPRTTHIHVRGDFLNKGAEVQPGTIAVLHPFKPKNARPNRLDLAEWLTDPDNPLTARVAVNHFWKHLFGDGLVATMADFGTQGELPSHPELLDWLATEFLQRRWSRKEMIRLMVTSATYRQSAASRDDLIERDAKNRWLARQNRFRLNAENTRDQFLAASGLLDSTIGGPSVKPESRRRGLYLQFKRSFPEYMLVNFDAPNSTQPCPKRERSNTPLQALTLLNDPLFLQSARALAQRTLTEAPAQAAARARHAFQLCLARPPDADELRDLLGLLEQVRPIYAANTEAASQLIGETRCDQVSAPEMAAWTVVARAILNLDEVVTRE
jgi:hypothetical protein